MNPAITSCTIVGPGLKSRPMATYTQPTLKSIARARANADTQRQQREAREYAQSLAQLEQRLPPHVPQPPAPEMPAKLALHQEPDPQFAPAYLQSLLLGILLGGAAAILFEAGRQ